MPTIVRTERRKRGILGWAFLILFIFFNILMLTSLYAGLSGNAEMAAGLTSDAARAGHAVGTAIAAGGLIAVWAAGTIILGAFVLLTRGRKVIVETTSEDR